MAAGPLYFAWTGGPAVPAFDLLTTGDTFGGSVQTVGQIWGGRLSTVGDIVGLTSIANLTETSGLVAGQSYLILGAGILNSADGFDQDTFFTFDGSTGGSLSQATTEAAGVSLILISAAGTNQVLLASTANLVTGVTYGIAASGIPAETTFAFDGSNPITISAGATNTGLNVSIRMTSPLGRDVIANLADVTGLVPGVAYNLFGLGIPSGTTALFDGSVSFNLSAEATVTRTAAQILISTPASFPDGGPFNPAVHEVVDEDIVALQLTHAEGSFAELTIDVRNPEVGLLGAGRNLWCWLSWDSGSAVVPLFHGRLVGVPAQMADEQVRLAFVARPEDFVAQKSVLAASMQTGPYWDPVWLIEHEADPDTVLEARTERWHIGRTDLVVSASDIVTGEDGTLLIGEADHLYDHFAVSYAAAPLRRVNVTGAVAWTQVGEGDVDLTGALWGAFSAVGSAAGYPVITSFTGAGLFASWPQPNTSIGGGWTVGDAATIVQADWRVTGRYAVKYSAPTQAGVPQQETVTTPVPAETGATSGDLSGVFHGITTYGTTVSIPNFSEIVQGGYQTYDVLFDRATFAINFPVHYSASRSRRETIAFSLEATVQSIMTEPGVAEEETLSLSSAFIDQPIDPGGALPIVDLRRNAYFPTDRGRQSFEYLLLLARAKLVSRARAVVIKFVTTWANAVVLSCRWNVQLLDRRLPGGAAAGKVASYMLTATGNGEFSAEVTIRCTVGYGVAITAVAGSDVYDDGDYSDDNYTQQVGGQTELLPGELVYQNIDNIAVIDDDGVDFFNMTPETIVMSIEIEGGLAAQKAVIDASAPLVMGDFAPPRRVQFLSDGVTPAPVIPQDPVSALKVTPTRVNLELVPVTGGMFESDFYVLTSALVVAQTINLEA